MINKEELDRLTEIEVCMELLEEFNEFADVEKFDLDKSRRCLESMSLEQLLEKSEQISELIYKHRFVLYMDDVINDIKRYGLEYAKNKYNLEMI